MPPTIPSRTLSVAPPLLAAIPQETFTDRVASANPTGVPDLRGMDARAANARATAAGLPVRLVGSGVVQAQIPQPGEALSGGGRIVLTLSPEILPPTARVEARRTPAAAAEGTR